MSKRPFVGHVVSGRPVTMKDGKDAGIIKPEPQEISLEEQEKLKEQFEKNMKDGEEIIAKYNEWLKNDPKVE